jgi:cell division protein FtsB/cell division protein DivIC
MNLVENRLFRFLILIVSFGLCLSAGGTILDLWHRRDVVSLRQKDLDRISQENASLQKQLSDSQQQGYVERVARDKLGLVKDGEAIVLLEPSTGDEVNANGEKGTIVSWQQWWRLFF